MSALQQLETELANLVASSNALLAEFNGKKAAIDAAVAAAVAAAPSTSKTFIVDAVNGSDTTGLGSIAAPFKTIKKAVDSAPVGGVVYVRLVGNYTYTMSANVDYSAKQVVINQLTSPPDQSQRPTIVFEHYTDEVYNHLYGFITPSGPGNLVISSVNITVVADYDAGKATPYSYSVCETVGHGSSSSFYVRDSDVDLGENGAALVNSNNGIGFAGLHNSNFLHNSGDIINTGAAGLASVCVNTCTKNVGVNWYSNAAQVLSNV